MGRSEQISAEWLRDEIAAIYEDAAGCGLTVVATNLAGAIAARLASPEPEVEALARELYAAAWAVDLDDHRWNAIDMTRYRSQARFVLAREQMWRESMPIPVADGDGWECECVVCHETNTPAVHEWYVCESCGKGRAPIPPDEADLVADGEVERAAILRNIPEDVEKSSLTDCRRSWLVKPKAAKVAGRSAFAHWVYMNLTNSSRDRRAAAKQAWNAALDQAIQICRQTNGSQCAAAHQIERLKEDQ